DAIVKSVGPGDLAGETDDRALVDRVHAAGARSTRHQPQNPGSCTEVQHHVTGLDDLLDRLPERGDARGVRQVLTMLVATERHRRRSGSARPDQRHSIIITPPSPTVPEPEWVSFSTGPYSIRRGVR